MDDAKPRQDTAGATPTEPPPIDTTTPLFSNRPFALLFTTRLASNTANQMLAVVVGYQVYELTDSALNLGLIGLVQFLPPLLLMLVAGQLADRYNRRLILRCCYVTEFLMSLGLLIVVAHPQPSVPAIYALLFANACARTFEQPCVPSLLPVLVPRPLLSRAVAAHVFAGRASILFGPSIGGVLYVFGHAIPYGVCAVLVLIAAIASFLLPNPPPPKERPKVTWDHLLAGFRFIGRTQAVLGAMLFDLVATLFGGVSMLIPIFARDVLDIGAWGAGILRSAPAIGALIAGATLTRFPVQRHGGVFMFAGMTAFGAGTIVFGLSETVVISILALMVIGCGDMVSSVIRQTLIQVNTPDDMRGRVFAVNSLSIGTSGQLGGFYSGVTAALFGAVTAVVIGGCAVFATVALWAWLFPALRRVGRPDAPQQPGGR